MEYIPFPDKKYNIIYADPPWKFASGIRSLKKLMGFINYTPGWDVWGNEV